MSRWPSLHSYSIQRNKSLQKWQKMFFTRLFPNDLIDEDAKYLKKDIIEKLPIKQSKTEELNDILCQQEN